MPRANSDDPLVHPASSGRRNYQGKIKEIIKRERKIAR